MHRHYLTFGEKYRSVKRTKQVLLMRLYRNHGKVYFGGDRWCRYNCYQNVSSKIRLQAVMRGSLSRGNPQIEMISRLSLSRAASRIIPMKQRSGGICNPRLVKIFTRICVLSATGMQMKRDFHWKHRNENHVKNKIFHYYCNDLCFHLMRWETKRRNGEFMERNLNCSSWNCRSQNEMRWRRF